MATKHSTLTTTDLHKPGYVTASDPGAVGAGVLWIDTSGTNWVAKIRNDADDGWEIVTPPNMVTPSSTDILTNKTFDADGTGNSLSNVDIADFTSGIINNATDLASPAVGDEMLLGDISNSNATRKSDIDAILALYDSKISTLTNKTFNANGTGNSLSNVDVADLADGTDGELITWAADASPTTVGAGTNGQVLTSNGAGSAPTFQDAASGGGGGLTWSVISSNTNASADNGYLIDASGGNVTLTLPGSPSEGDAVGACDYNEQATINTITVDRNGNNIEGSAEDLTIDVNGAGFTLVYSDATRGWEIVSEISGGIASLIEDTTPQLGGDLDLNDNDIKSTSGDIILQDDNSGGIHSTPNQSGCSVYLSSDQTITHGNGEKLQLDTENWDTQNEYDPITNYRWTATKAGKYQVNAHTVSIEGDEILIDLYLGKNGSSIRRDRRKFYAAGGGAKNSNIISAVVDIAAGDYLELFVSVYNYTDSGNVVIEGFEKETYFEVIKLQ